MAPKENSDKKLPVSVCIIAYNEEAMIGDCLASISGFDDIIVIIDAKTSDRTLSIAERYGCRVFIESWKGDGPQKQSAVDKSSHDWVLILDADERLSPEGETIIRNALNTPSSAVAFSLRRRSYIGTRLIRHSGWWPDVIVRLFDKRYCKIRGGTHASLHVEGKTVPLPAILDHFSYRNYAHMIEKMNTYSSWMANELAERKRRCLPLTPLFHGLWMFFRTYVIKRGFLDGLDGLTISVINATGSYLKYAKLRERYRR